MKILSQITMLNLKEGFLGNKMKILFVCKYNQTRSQIAREIFDKLNKNVKIKTDSAGIIDPNTSGKDLISERNLFKKYGLKYRKRKQLNNNLLYDQDMIIVVADDVPLNIFSSQKKKGIKIVRWSVKDGYKYKGTKKEKIEKIYSDINRKVEKFVEELK